MILRRRTSRYQGFPDLRSCWEQSEDHKEYFMRYMDCVEKSKYHRQVHACKDFDRLIERWSEPIDSTKFFHYYDITGKTVRDNAYLVQLISDRQTLLKYAANSIRKKTPEKLASEGIELPEVYGDWSIEFNIPALLLDEQEIREMIGALNNCIQRRQLFRNLCVKACCKKIDTESHDIFLRMLQILRAQIIVYFPNIV
jgi:hypothetical protein